MFDRAIEQNLKGDYFPIMAVCLGHEQIHYILSDYDKNVRISVVDESPTKHGLDNVTRSANFYKEMSDQLFNELTHQNISYYHHSYAIGPALYAKHSKVNEYLEITSYNSDTQGTIFIGSTQGKQFPIYTTQYHSEKNPFEWNIPANHSDAAIKITAAHSNAFIAEVFQLQIS